MSLQWQIPVSFEEKTVTEKNSPLRFQAYCTSPVTAMNRFRIQRGGLLCPFWGAHCFCWLITSATSREPVSKKEARTQRHIAAVIPFEVNSRLALLGADPDFLLHFFFVSVLFCFFIFSFVFSSAPFLLRPMLRPSCIGLGGLCSKGHQTIEVNL